MKTKEEFIKDFLKQTLSINNIEFEESWEIGGKHMIEELSPILSAYGKEVVDEILIRPEMLCLDSSTTGDYSNTLYDYKAFEQFKKEL